MQNAANLTVRIDEEYSEFFTKTSSACLDSSDGWPEYDSCMEPWLRGAAHVARLRQVTLNLDPVSGRTQRKVAACEWFQAVARVHDAAHLPSTKVAMSSPWRNKC